MTLYGFARAGFQWVPALETNALCDTFTWTVRYPMDDVNGDTVFNALPDFVRNSFGQPIRGWDFSVRGRDSGPSDAFQQYVLLDGEQQLVNQYNTKDFGRRTSPNFGFQRFFITRVPALYFNARRSVWFEHSPPDHPLAGLVIDR